MLSRLLSPVRGNPILARHVATTFTGPRLGAAFLLVTGALVTLYTALFTAATYGDLVPGEMYFSHNVLLLGLLIVLIPIKVSGIVEGPRMSRAFDQIVVTGASPSLLYAGAWISGLAYAALLLFVTVPFAACMVTFGEVSPGDMLVGYVTLLLYSNVIIAVVLGVSVFGREWMTTPISIAVLGTLCVFAVIPDRDWLRFYPTVLAELSPMRALLQSIVDEPSLNMILHAPDPAFLRWSIPVELVRPVLWTLVVGAVIVTIGPGHVFTHGLDNFGAVVLPGDRKRGILGRLRGGLTRRVEMGFFYENAPRWTRVWGTPIRWLFASMPLVIVWGLLFGSLFQGPPMLFRSNILHDEQMMSAIYVGGGLLVLWIILSCTTRRSGAERLQMGPFRIPRDVAIVTLFFGYLGILLWFEYLPFAEIVEARDAGTLRLRARMVLTKQEFAAYVNWWWRVTGSMLLLVTNLFLIARIASRLTNKVLWSRALAVLGLGLVLAIPPIIAELISEGLLSLDFAPLASLTPAIFHIQFRAADWTPFEGWQHYMTAQCVLAGVLTLSYLVTYVRLRRPAARGTAPALALAIALFCVGANGPVAAQDPPERQPEASTFPLKIQTIARGFDGRVFSSHVDFYTVSVHNPGTSPLNADYWIEGENTEWGHGEFTLSPGSTRWLRITAPPQDRRRVRDVESRLAFRVGRRTLRSGPLDLDLILDHRTNRPRSNRPRSKPKRREQYLFIGQPGRFPQLWMDKALDGSSRNLVTCPPRDLPVAARNYDGVEVVWLTTTMLREFTRRQRAALHEYMLLGGAVVFSGGVPAADLGGTGPWEELLRPKSTSFADLEGRQLQKVEFEEGHDALFVTPEDGGAPVPILNVRRVGAGAIAHLAFPPIVGRMPQSAVLDPRFWTRFDAALPRSIFPVVASGVGDSRGSPEVSSLLLLGGYYALYALVLSGGLFFFVRRRQQRRRLWLHVTILPLLFLGLVPVLTGVIHSEPSLAEFTEVEYFHAGSTRGVVARHLRINSSGKQDHDIVWRADSPLAYHRPDSRPYYRYYWFNRSFGENHSISGTRRPGNRTGSGLDDWEYRIEMSPWSISELFVYDRIRRRNTVSGVARRTRTGFDVDVRVPEALRERELFVVARPRTGGFFSKRVQVQEDGRIQQSIETKGRQRRGMRVHREFFVQSSSTQNQLWIAVAPPKGVEAPLPLKSPDLVFEHGVPRYVVERQRVQPRRTGIPRRRLRKVGSDHIEKLDHRLLLFEIPVLNPAR